MSADHNTPWDLPTYDVNEPLLPRQPTSSAHEQTTQHEQPGRPQQRQKPGSSKLQEGPHNRLAAVDLGTRFLQRLWRILCLINAAPALSLVLISLAETVIVSKIGTISGLFYQVFVDGQASKVPHLMLWSAGCYTATALFYSFKSGLQDFFAWRWRATLTLQLQQVYCNNVGAICPRSLTPLLQSLDSPDQRVAQDLPLLTASLSEVLTQLAAVPFNIIWYTHLTHQVFGSWLPVGCAYLFFLVGLVLQRLVMLPVASAVFHQEAAEGVFRYGHTRFRAWAAEIAMYRSEAVEQQHLEGQLARVLVCQGRLMLRRAVVTATSRLLEYGGLVVNFGCLAVAVFSGAWSGQGQSAGDIASKVSVASFYLLTLIYNFSQVLDLASKVANLAGLTARVSQMLEALQDQGAYSTKPTHPYQHRDSGSMAHRNPSQHIQHSSSSSSTKHNRSHGLKQQKMYNTHSQGSHSAKSDVWYKQSEQSQQQQQRSPNQQPLQEVAAGKSPSHQRYASQAVLLQKPHLVLVPAPAGVAAAADAPETDSTHAAQQPFALVSAMLLEAAAAHNPQQQEGAPQQQQQQPKQDAGFTLSQQPPAATPGLDHSLVSHPITGMTNHDIMQVSIHSMGADMLLQEVRRAFPDSPRLAPLLAVVTFQFCGAARWHMLHKLQMQLGAQQQQQPQQQQQSQLQQQQQQLVQLGGLQRLHMGVGSSGNSSSAGSSSGGLVPLGHSCCPSCSTNLGTCDGVAAGTTTTTTAAAAGGCSWQQGLCGDADMQHMLAVFMSWQQAVYDHITNRGYWCDTVDPRSGTALHSTPGSHYDEVIGASVLLGYDQVTPAGQSFSLISHPEAATQVYPATLFTSAPLPVVREALRAAAAVAAAPPPTPLPNPVALLKDNSNTEYSIHQQQQLASGNLIAASSSVSAPGYTPSALHSQPVQSVQHHQGPQQQQQQQQLLGCTSLQVSTPAGVPVVADLTLQLHKGGYLLIQGPSGCGKSTLLYCLAGLWPADAGRISMLTNPCSATATGGSATACGTANLEAGAGFSGHGGVLFVPQRSLAGPGVTLRQQLLYPAAASKWPCSCSCSSHTCHSIQQGWSRQQQQQQQQSARQEQRPGSSSGWWLNWLSCGLLQRHQQQQQQQQQQLLWVSSGAVLSAPLAGKQHLKQQRQLSLPPLPPLPVSAISLPLQQQQQQQQLAQLNLCPSCQQLLSVLDLVGLSYFFLTLPDGLLTQCEAWGDVLSPGEMQRLTFARVLLHMPSLVVLDEATSALPDAAAVQLYRLLQCAGVSYVSVGHSSSLREVHDRVLSISGDGSGGWELT